MAEPRHRAIVDCGSNSTRLWLAPPGGADGAPTRVEQITRLGRGVDATGHLDDERLAHCLRVVGGYGRQWRDAGVRDDEVVVIATSAVRDAVDRDRFFDGIRRVCGVEARVLTGEEEARASYRGATTALDVPAPIVVVDIGGGSTELVLGLDDRGPRRLAATSLQLGTVRLTERHLPSDPPSPDEVQRARDQAREILTDGLARIGLDGGATGDRGTADDGSAGPGRPRTVVGVAGTALSLARLHAHGNTRRDGSDLHGQRLPRVDLEWLANELLGRSRERRVLLGPIEPGRVDVLAAGALILATLVELLGADEVVVSEADVMDGVAHGALG